MFGKGQNRPRENSGTATIRNRIQEQVTDIFKDQIDVDVITLILEQYDWKAEEAIEMLFQLASDDKKTKASRQDVDLAIIACSLLDMDEGQKEVSGGCTDSLTPSHVSSKAKISLHEEAEISAESHSVEAAAFSTSHRRAVSDGSSLNQDSGAVAASSDLPSARGVLAEVTFPTSDSFSEGCQFDPKALAATEESVMQIYEEMFQKSQSKSPTVKEDGKQNFDPVLKFSESPNEASYIGPVSMSAEVQDSEESFVVLSEPPSLNRGHGTDFKSIGATETIISRVVSADGLKDKPTSHVPTLLTSSNSPGAVHVNRQQDNSSLVSVSSSFEVIQETGLISAGRVISSSNAKGTQKAAEDCTSSDTTQSNSASFGSYSNIKSERQSDQKQVLATDSVNTTNKVPTTGYLQAADMGLSPEAPEFVPMFSSPASVPQPQFYTPWLSVGTSSQRMSSQHYFAGNRGPSPYLLTPSSTGSFHPSVRNVAIGNLLGANLYQAPRPTCATVRGNAAAENGHCTTALQASVQSSGNLHETNPYKQGKNIRGDANDASAEKVRSYTDTGTKLLVILRGLPGSGKSYLAKTLQGSGKVFSTDDYFVRDDEYIYSPDELSEAHAWNKRRVRDALDQGVTPVFVDNTNIMMWEMLPYAQMADDRGYAIEVIEPETPWKFQPKRLAKCNSHGVSLESIKRMKDRYQMVSTITLRAHLDKLKSDPGRTKIGARDSLAQKPTKDKGAATPAVTSKQPVKDKKSVQGQEYVQKRNNSVEGRSPRHPAPVPVRLPAHEKKNSKKQRKQTLAVWEYIAGLIEEGATEDEVEAFIYMAKLTDSEKEEIKQWRESSAAAGNVVCNENHSNPNKLDTLPTSGAVDKGRVSPSHSFGKLSSKSENASGSFGSNMETKAIHESKLAVDSCNIGTTSSQSADLAGVMQWEDPKPQRKFKKSLILQEKQQQVECGKIVIPTESSSSASQSSSDNYHLQDEGVPQVDMTWEDPKPRRECRVLRTPRTSASDAVESSLTEVTSSAGEEVREATIVDVPPAQTDIIDTEDDVQSCTDSSSNSENSGIRNDSDVIIEEETEEILSFVVLGDGSDAEESIQAEQGILETDAGLTEVTLSAVHTGKGVAAIDDEHKIFPEECLADSSIVLVDYSSSSEGEKVTSGTLPLNTMSQQVESDISRSSISPETSVADSSLSASQASSQASSPRKKVRRKKHKVAPTPFLDDNFKVQLNSDSWKALSPTMQITEMQNSFSEMSDNSNMAGVMGVGEGRPLLREASSQTEVQDFNIMFMVETSDPSSSVPLEQGYKYAVSREQYVFVDAPVVTAHSTNGKQMLDKSTSIDLALEQVEPDMEILQNCFPEVAVEHLKEVLDVCGGSMEWATNLLLDWGISTPFTPQDKHQLRKEMAKQQGCFSAESSPLTSEGLDPKSFFQPQSLFDLCQDRLSPSAEGKKMADDVQRHIISSGYQRLQRIESHELERVRGISFEGEGPSGITGNITSLSVFTATSPNSNLGACTGKMKASSSGSSAKASHLLKDVVEVVFSSSSSNGSSHHGSLDDLPSALVDKDQDLRQLPQTTVGDNCDPTATMTENTGYLMLALPGTLVAQLEQLFGSLPQHTAGSHVVGLDYTTAYHLHECLAQSLSGQGSSLVEEKKLQQLREDEALAQWLQAEEETEETLRKVASPAASTASPSPPARRLPSRQSVAVGGISIQDRSTRGLSQSARPPSVYLQDIMEEEMARQRQHEMQMKQLEATGSHIAIATKLKREKLYQYFPGIDEHFLEEIFQANGFCLETTVSVIESALGSKQPVPHKLAVTSAASKTTDDPSVEVDRGVEAAKKQSLLDMLNDAWQNTSKYQRVDLTDGTEPDYQELRQEALVHHRMRGDCFRKAHEAFRRGMREVALFYSQQGHLHTQRMQEANMRASHKILEAREARLNEESTLDLHGLHVDEAIAALKRVMEEKEREFQQKPVHNRRYLYVITGRGKHSQHGVAKIRPAITAHLTTTGHKFSEVHAGMLKVSLHHVPQ